MPREAMRQSEARLAEPRGPKSSWAQPPEKPREVKTCLRFHSETWAGLRLQKTVCILEVTQAALNLDRHQASPFGSGTQVWGTDGKEELR